MKRFLKFIKEEQEKIDPTPKVKVKKKKKDRHPNMPDDSVSEITDLEKEEILAKYYEDKLSAIEKRKRERAESRARLRGETKAVLEDKHSDLVHVCKKPPKNLKLMARDPMEETVEMELRPKSEGKSLHDEEGSAH